MCINQFVVRSVGDECRSVLCIEHLYCGNRSGVVISLSGRYGQIVTYYMVNMPHSGVKSQDILMLMNRVYFLCMIMSLLYIKVIGIPKSIASRLPTCLYNIIKHEIAQQKKITMKLT